MILGVFISHVFYQALSREISLAGFQSGTTAVCAYPNTAGKKYSSSCLLFKLGVTIVCLCTVDQGQKVVITWFSRKQLVLFVCSVWITQQQQLQNMTLLRWYVWNHSQHKKCLCHSGLMRHYNSLQKNEFPLTFCIEMEYFSPTWSCVSLTRSTTSSEWKLFRFDKMEVNSSVMNLLCFIPLRAVTLFG